MTGDYQNYSIRSQYSPYTQLSFAYRVECIWKVYVFEIGRAMTGNAIRLLHLMGFEDEIIREAEQMAENSAGRQIGYGSISG